MASAAEEKTATKAKPPTLNNFSLAKGSTLLFSASSWEGRNGFDATKVYRDETFTANAGVAPSAHSCRVYDVPSFLCDQRWVDTRSARLELSDPSNIDAVEAVIAKSLGDKLKATLKRTDDGEALHISDITFDTADKFDGTDLITAIQTMPTVVYVEPDKINRAKAAAGGHELPHLPITGAAVMRTVLQREATYIEHERADLGKQRSLYLRQLYMSKVGAQLARKKKEKQEKKEKKKKSDSGGEESSEKKDGAEDDEDEDDDDEEDEEEMKAKMVAELTPQEEARILRFDQRLDNLTSKSVLIYALVVCSDHLDCVYACQVCGRVIAVVGQEAAKNHCKEQMLALQRIDAVHEALAKLTGPEHKAKRKKLNRKVKDQMARLASGGILAGSQTGAADVALTKQALNATTVTGGTKQQREQQYQQPPHPQPLGAKGKQQQGDKGVSAAGGK